jgi:glycosyltransferase involved in cell wall biosynthesis
MNVSLTGCVPFYNNKSTVVSALKSLADQSLPIDELFGLNDASTDGGQEFLEANGFRCLHQPTNLGRGAARNRAMSEATGELVVCCDATNVLPKEFVRSLLHWFDDPKVAAVYGWIQDAHPRGAVSRWRARHLFKAGHPMKVERRATLITYGTILRRSAVLQVGNFNPSLPHSEDAELGKRLLQAGYDIIGDPSVPVLCNVQNTLWQVMERYCRWYFGDDHRLSYSVFLKSVAYSLKVMFREDLRDVDLQAGFISLLLPYYRLLRSLQTYWRIPLLSPEF